MDPISYEIFQALINKAKKYYTASYGCLVKLYGAHIRKGVDLCIASTANENLFIPENCKIWKSSALLFTGKLTNNKVLDIVNENAVCCAEVTDTKSMEFGRHGNYYCLQSSNCYARCEKCKAIKLTSATTKDIPKELHDLWEAKLSLVNKRIHRSIKARKGLEWGQ